jgi:pSer/pThr/pTyr-binding forkhead associated (FHA) protein
MIEMMNSVTSGEVSVRETSSRTTLNEPLAAARVLFVVTTGENAPQVLEFGTRPFLTVGRAEPADVCVDDPGVSRVHARFLREAGGIRVLDLGSRNGTWVRGLRVTEALLVTGDCVTVGDSTTLLIQAAPRVPSARDARDARDAINTMDALDVRKSYGEPAIADSTGLVAASDEVGFGPGINLRASLREHEAKLIREALRLSCGNQRRAAALLELPLRTFERKLRNMLLRQRAISRAAM